jgi:superfamily II DNA/RNA helicase
MTQETQPFALLGLREPLLRVLRELSLETPTAAQTEIIPAVLEGRDILGIARPGTGRTAAFGLPFLQLVRGEAIAEALVLVPNRDMAMRVGDDLRDLGRDTGARVATVFGGQRMRIQADRLAKNPSIIVGTPERVMEMHSRGLIPFDNVRHVALEEIDHLLDMGFRDDLGRIMSALPPEHQTIFVSAAMSQEIERLARQYLRDPVHVTSDEGEPAPAAEVRHRYLTVDPWDKNRLLLHLLEHEEPAPTLVFCRSRQTADALASYLQRKGIEARAVHSDGPSDSPGGAPGDRGGRGDRGDRRDRGDRGDRGERGDRRGRGRRGDRGDRGDRRDRRDRDDRHGPREESPRRHGPPILVTSDHAAVGLDVPGIGHVINFDLPEEPEMYVHRVGRATAAGPAAEAWTFVTPDEENRVPAFERVAGVRIEREIYEDFRPGPPPAEPAVVKAPGREAEAPREATRGDVARSRRTPPSPDEAADRSKFPGGLVPAALPARRMGGRLRTGRK